MLILRKLVKRVKGLAYNQFSGTATSWSHAGIAAGLPHRESVHAGTGYAAPHRREHRRRRAQRNKMARVSSRSNPLMETLAASRSPAACCMAATACRARATPGQFFSFMTAFLLATEPAKRLARLNIDLNSQLVGAGCCWKSSTVGERAP